MKPLDLSEAELAELLLRGRAGDAWFAIGEVLSTAGSLQTLRRRWTELSTVADKRERKSNIARRRAKERAADEYDSTPGRDVIAPAPECQFKTPGIYFTDDPRAVAKDTGKVPTRTQTWLPRQVAGAFR